MSEVKMKKILTAFFAFLALMFSCKGNKTDGPQDAPADSDSIRDTAVVDTMEQIISETPISSCVRDTTRSSSTPADR